jgi:hypothetical protein
MRGEGAVQQTSLRSSSRGYSEQKGQASLPLLHQLQPCDQEECRPICDQRDDDLASLCERRDPTRVRATWGERQGVGVVRGPAK